MHCATCGSTTASSHDVSYSSCSCSACMVTMHHGSSAVLALHGCSSHLLCLPCAAGELYLEFTQIDPQQPERPFGFAMQVVGDDNRYTGKRRSSEDVPVSRLVQQLACAAWECSARQGYSCYKQGSNNIGGRTMGASAAAVVCWLRCALL